MRGNNELHESWASTKTNDSTVCVAEFTIVKQKHIYKSIKQYINQLRRSNLKSFYSFIQTILTNFDYTLNKTDS